MLGDDKWARANREARKDLGRLRDLLTRRLGSLRFARGTRAGRGEPDPPGAVEDQREAATLLAWVEQQLHRGPRD